MYEITPAIPNPLERDFRSTPPVMKPLDEIIEFTLSNGILLPAIDCYEGRISCTR